MYKALYRTWRPMSFDDVISQPHITETLQNQVRTGKTAHAYLFTGSRGTGKTTCARILAKAVNCPHAVNGNPCLECDICKDADRGILSDVIEIDAASNNSVEDIRDLREGTVYRPERCAYKIYIIDEAEKLTQAVTGAIENLQDHLSLEEADVYKKPTVLKDDASLAEQLDKMNKYAKMSVTYQFGDSTETLNGDQIHAWLIANADGSVSVDSSKVS